MSEYDPSMDGLKARDFVFGSWGAKFNAAALLGGADLARKAQKERGWRNLGTEGEVASRERPRSLFACRICECGGACEDCA